MRALAENPLWAAVIIDGLKTIEARSRPTNIRGRVAIYASKAKQSTLEGEYGPEYNYRILPTGMILGTVEIYSCEPCKSLSYFELYKSGHLAPDEYYKEDKTYFWHLRRPQKFDVPILIKWPSTGSWAQIELPEVKV